MSDELNQLMDQRTPFGEELSRLVIDHRSRGTIGKEDIIGTLLGTAAAEAIFAKWSVDEFIKICEVCFRLIADQAAKLR